MSRRRDKLHRGVLLYLSLCKLALFLFTIQLSHRPAQSLLKLFNSNGCGSKQLLENYTNAHTPV